MNTLYITYSTETFREPEIPAIDIVYFVFKTESGDIIDVTAKEVCMAEDVYSENGICVKLEDLSVCRVEESKSCRARVYSGDPVVMGDLLVGAEPIGYIPANPQGDYVHTYPILKNATALYRRYDMNGDLAKIYLSKPHNIRPIADFVLYSPSQMEL